MIYGFMSGKRDEQNLALAWLDLMNCSTPSPPSPPSPEGLG
jgi:hypothetical protein